MKNKMNEIEDIVQRIGVPLIKAERDFLFDQGMKNLRGMVDQLRWILRQDMIKKGCPVKGDETIP